MSEILVGALKLGFLALLWLFVLFVVLAIKTDLFGQKVSPPNQPKESRRQSLGRRKRPTTLRVVSGSQTGVALPIGEELRIGRSADCQLIMDDDYVSTRHARIHADGRDVILTDLGSTNGTFVNDERISMPTPVTPSDSIRIGRTLMQVEV